MPVQTQRVERDEGSGAGSEIEDLYDSEEYQTKDQRSPNRTTYYRRDIDQHVTDERTAWHLRRALRWQEGQYVTSDNEDEQSRGQQNYEEDKRRIVGVLASQLGLTSSQKRRVEHLVLDVVDVNSFGHYSVEQVTLGVINVVAREDERWIEDERLFRDYMEQVGITNDRERADLNTMRRLRSLVRERVPSKGQDSD